MHHRKPTGVVAVYQVFFENVVLVGSTASIRVLSGVITLHAGRRAFGV